MTTKKKTEVKSSYVVSFRVDASYAKRLYERAEKAGKSPGDLVRRMLLRELENDPEDETAARLAEVLARCERLEKTVRRQTESLEEMVALLRRQSLRLSDSVQVLLVNGGKMTPDAAREFARKYLVGDESP